jgi:hypothetical protein
MADEVFSSTGKIRRRDRAGSPASGSATSSTIGGAPAAAGSPEVAMEPWLQQQLQRLYDDLVNEPLPPELRDLIDRIGRRVGNT